MPQNSGGLKAVPTELYHDKAKLIYMLLSTLSAQEGMNLLIYATVIHIEASVKEEHQLACAEGVAEAIVANFKRTKEEQKEEQN